MKSFHRTKPVEMTILMGVSGMPQYGCSPALIEINAVFKQMEVAPNTGTYTSQEAGEHFSTVCLSHARAIIFSILPSNSVRSWELI
jgi:hypothetical protein